MEPFISYFTQLQLIDPALWKLIPIWIFDATKRNIDVLVDISSFMNSSAGSIKSGYLTKRCLLRQNILYLKYEFCYTPACNVNVLIR